MIDKCEEFCIVSCIALTHNFQTESVFNHNAPLKFKLRPQKSHDQTNITFGKPGLWEAQPSFPLRYSFFNQ
ncbi:hypothetical protein CJJ13_01375 [Serratia fonticola]|nr:hypothetical protein CJJ13_01375 [Serratia fonticola]